MVLQVDPSLEKKGLRFNGKDLRAEGQAEPPWAMLSCSGVSASTCICAQSNREVHRASTSDGISADNRIVFSREELRRRKPRHSLHRVALGLCTEAESGIKSVRYRNHAKSEPSRVGRDWPVMAAKRELSRSGVRGKYIASSRLAFARPFESFLRMAPRITGKSS